MKITKIETHKTKRLVRVFFEDGQKIVGTERQFMTDWDVGGKDVGQRLIAAAGPSFAGLADARHKIELAFADWDRLRDIEREEEDAYSDDD